MQKKLTIGVLFGGRSGEHEVSLVSATSIINALDRQKYNVIPIGITKGGKWFCGDSVLVSLKEGKAPNTEDEVAVLADPSRKGLYNLKTGQNIIVDVIFPVIHGTFGEDGTVQGLFDLAGIPYVGAGVLGSSVGMDKIIQKDLAKNAGFDVTPYIWFLKSEFKSSPDEIIKRIESEIGYPCFVKPANSGSSVGINKSHNKNELKEHINEAINYDRRIIIEKSVENAKEIEISVLGNDKPIASACGQIISSNEFYDYNAKYVDGKSKVVIPADLPDNISAKVKQSAISIFKTLDLSGMTRADFLVTKDKIYFNEVNTIPGFTSISMYPKMLEASGIPYKELLTSLINLALERFNERAGLSTTYKPKEDWYK